MLHPSKIPFRSIVIFSVLSFVVGLSLGMFVAYPAHFQAYLRENYGVGSLSELNRILSPHLQFREAYSYKEIALFSSQTALVALLLSTRFWKNDRHRLSRKILLTIVFIGFLGGCLSGDRVSLASAQSATYVVRPEGAFVKTTSYIIYTLNGNFYAVNGLYGTVPYKGAEAETVLQSAIHALPEGTVFIKDGIYPIGSDIYGKNKVNIIGESMYGTILRAELGVTYLLRANEGSELRIAYLTLDGNNITSGCLRWGETTATHDFTIEHVYMKNAISDGYICNLFKVGERIRVLYCIFDGQGNSSNGFVGGGLDGSLFAYNIAKDITLDGFKFGALRRSKVIGNSVFNAGQNGFTFESAYCEFSEIAENTAYNITNDGFKCEVDVGYFLTFRDNWALYCGNRGFRDAVSYTAYPHHKFIGNHIINATTGISMTTADWSNIYGHYFEGNHFINISLYGIETQRNSQDEVIINNEFYNVATPLKLNLNSPLIIKDNVGFVTENSIAFTNLANGSYIAHGLAGTPDHVTITLSTQGYAWYGALNSTHIQLYFSTPTANGTVWCQYKLP